jgi:periplasmic divalent cation tolerance protein
MLIAWTTVPNLLAANELAAAIIKARLAACVQVEGPITSHYVWEGVEEKAEEYRLTIKTLPAQAEALQLWIHERHPYQIPEWVVVQAEHVSEKYLSWARSIRSKLAL